MVQHQGAVFRVTVGNTFCPRGTAQIKYDVLLLLNNATPKTTNQKTEGISELQLLNLCGYDLTSVSPQTTASEGTLWVAFVCHHVDLPMLGIACEWKACHVVS